MTIKIIKYECAECKNQIRKELQLKIMKEIKQFSLLYLTINQGNLLKSNLNKLFEGENE